MTELPSGFPTDPVAGLLAWIGDARAAGVSEPSACALATATADGAPSVRIVLARGWAEGGLVFHTNYGSRKGRELAANPRCAVTFHWRELERQARLEGRAQRLSEAASEDYWAGRPRQSQLSALASEQSAPMSSRGQLEARVAELAGELGGKPVPRPPGWGGFVIVPAAIELWRADPGRLHERVRWECGEDGVFVASLLQP